MEGWAVAGARRAILDVDTGVDDAMALALAVRAAGLDLVAATTVAGNVGLANTTENTRRVLAFVGAGEVPVHRGLSRPLSRPIFDAANIHGDSGLGDLVLPPAPGAASYPSAPQFLVDAIMAAPGEITLICVGPLTNLASAIALEPGLPEAIGALVLMGGSLESGNATPYAEFNIYADPEAAAQVFAAFGGGTGDAPKLTMVGLDVTRRTFLDRPMRETLAGNDSPEAHIVYGATAEGFLTRGWELFRLHDPLAVGTAIDPSFCTMRRGTLAVETADPERAGQTTLREEADGPHLACVAVDAPRFLAFFADTLGLPRFAAS